MMEIQHNVSLRPYNSFGLDVKSSHFLRVRNLGELQEIFKDFTLKDMPRLVLGGGSNLLLTRDFEGLAIVLEMRGKDVVSESAEAVTIEVEAGENWHELVLFAIENDWGGLENMSLIPGKVGAAPIQNIGAYGVELKDVFAYLDWLDTETLQIRRFYAEDCAFGYRNSVFKNELKGKGIIVRVAFHLTKPPHPVNISYGAIGKELEARGIAEPTIRDVSDVVIDIRRSKLPDPAEIGNSGSFFKNPELPNQRFEEMKAQWPELPGYPLEDGRTKVPAAWLIDQAGWKGKTFGNYGVHKNQALVLVNYGGASGSDIYQLSEKIMESVKEKFGVDLEREVNVF